MKDKNLADILERLFSIEQEKSVSWRIFVCLTFLVEFCPHVPHKWSFMQDPHLGKDAYNPLIFGWTIIQAKTIMDVNGRSFW